MIDEKTENPVFPSPKTAGKTGLMKAAVRERFTSLYNSFSACGAFSRNTLLGCSFKTGILTLPKISAHSDAIVRESHPLPPFPGLQLAARTNNAPFGSNLDSYLERNSSQSVDFWSSIGRDGAQSESKGAICKFSKYSPSGTSFGMYASSVIVELIRVASETS